MPVCFARGFELNITIHPELRAFVDPLSPIEYAALERSLLAEGCRDALVLWNDVLIDGHNRYDICRKHNIEFRTVQNSRFDSLEDVMLWMIENHLARRSVSDYQRGVLALRKKDIVSARAERSLPAETGSEAPAKPPVPKKEELAREARVSSQTIGQIERIQRAATPALMEAVRQGTISINAAANVASLPEAVQNAAVAGGKKELQQMARQVREQKAATRTPREPATESAQAAHADSSSASISVAAPRAPDEVAMLKARIAELTAENEMLKAQLANRS
jgi:hypothetical protein